MKLSIIIPVYNVEKYVEKTLASVCNQDYDDYEIIIINDGSPDNSLRICEEFAKTCSRNIKIISQANGGLSKARNTGFDNAKGEYIWFIDSDDWIKENCLKEIVAMLTDNVDELVIGDANVSDNGAIINEQNLFPKFDKSTVSGKEAWTLGINQLCAAVFTIYRREFLIKNNLRFMEGIYHEDAEFCPRASYLSSAIRYMSSVVYYVRQNPNSITRSFNAKKSFDDIIVAQSLLQFIEKEQISGPIRKYFLKFISVIINNSFHDIAIGDNNTIKTFEEYFRRSEVSSALLSSKQFKYMIEWFLISCNFAPLKVYKVLSLFKKSTWIKILYKNK